MAETATKLPIRTEKQESVQPALMQAWLPFENLRREMNHLFDAFDKNFWPTPFRHTPFYIEPFWRRWPGRPAAPAVDIVETDKAFKVTAELPGLDENDIEVKLVDGDLVIKGEKQEETKTQESNYCLHERHFGWFERCLRLPDGVDAAKIEANFKKGVLNVTLPKKAATRAPEKKIEVKAA